MARKNLLSGLVDAEHTEQAVSYPVRGASKSMIRSVNELARQADAYLEGENIVDLDPGSIDGSFVLDRMEDNREQYEELLQAIREHGQNSPILVRPHPLVDGRYMVVFGHRRVRVARELGPEGEVGRKSCRRQGSCYRTGAGELGAIQPDLHRKVDICEAFGSSRVRRETISSALGANAAAVSKMVSVASRIRKPSFDGSAPHRALVVNVGWSFRCSYRRNWMWSKSTWPVARSTTWRATIASSGYWRRSMPRASRFEGYRQR